MDPRFQKQKPVPDRQAMNELYALAGINPLNAHALDQLKADGFDIAEAMEESMQAYATISASCPEEHEPEVEDKNQSMHLGYSLKTGKLIYIMNLFLTYGVLVIGAIGSGKTNFVFHLLSQLYAIGIKCIFWDLKGECRRIIDYWDDAMLFTPKDAPWQWLEPPPRCDPLTYGMGVISEIRTEMGLRDETFPLLNNIWERILRGMKPGDPYPSIEDFRRIVEHEAKIQNRENLFTASRVLSSIETVMGSNARVRRAPDISNRYKIIAYEFVGNDPKMPRLFIGLHFNKLLLKAHNEEHTTELRAVEIIDEASPICSIELNQQGVGNLSSIKRFVSMARFTGTGLIIGGQNCSKLDSTVKNCGTVICFRTPSYDDAWDAGKLLGLPRESTDELMQLKPGEAYARSIGWDKAVKIKVPLFQP